MVLTLLHCSVFELVHIKKAKKQFECNSLIFNILYWIQNEQCFVVKYLNFSHFSSFCYLPCEYGTPVRDDALLLVYIGKIQLDKMTVEN